MRGVRRIFQFKQSASLFSILINEIISCILKAASCSFVDLVWLSSKNLSDSNIIRYLRSYKVCGLSPNLLSIAYFFNFLALLYWILKLLKISLKFFQIESFNTFLVQGVLKTIKPRRHSYLNRLICERSLPWYYNPQEEAILLDYRRSQYILSPPTNVWILSDSFEWLYNPSPPLVVSWNATPEYDLDCQNVKNVKLTAWRRLSSSQLNISSISFPVVFFVGKLNTTFSFSEVDHYTWRFVTT